MGRVAVVLAFERVTDESGAHIEEVKVDPGGDAVTTVEHFAPPGDDSPPLPGDFAAIDDSVGSGGERASGYNDPRNNGKAANGEKRFYARDAQRNVVAEFWMRGSGSVTIENGAGSVTLAADGNVSINGVTIDTSGNIVAPGDVTAMGAAAPVKLSTHLHPTPVGPTAPPTPG